MANKLAREMLLESMLPKLIKVGYVEEMQFSAGELATEFPVTVYGIALNLASVFVFDFGVYALPLFVRMPSKYKGNRKEFFQAKIRKHLATNSHKKY